MCSPLGFLLVLRTILRSSRFFEVGRRPETSLVILGSLPGVLWVAGVAGQAYRAFVAYL